MHGHIRIVKRRLKFCIAYYCGTRKGKSKRKGRKVKEKKSGAINAAGVAAVEGKCVSETARAHEGYIRIAARFTPTARGLQINAQPFFNGRCLWLHES